MEKFDNLRKAIIKENDKRKKYSIDRLKEIETLNFRELPWQHRELFTPAMKKHKFKSLKELRDYLKGRLEISYDKDLTRELKRLETIENTEKPYNVDFSISVEWKKNRTWGSNPTAEAYIPGLGNVSSGSIGGCGYDKQSTAVAKVLNQNNYLIFLLCQEKNRPKNKGKKNRDIFGYGSGYGIIPQIEGGVGVSCYPDIFNKIGLEFKTVASGKSFDAYSVNTK